MAARAVLSKLDPKRVERGRLAGAEDMYRIAAKVLTEHIDDRYDADELMFTEQLGKDSRDRKCKFELRYSEIRISERGTIGRQSVLLFEGTFLLQLHGVWKALQDEQPNAQWVPVAAVVISRYLGASEAVSEDEQADGGSLEQLYARSMAMLNPKKATSIGGTKKFVEVADSQLVGRIAFADLSQSDMQDPVSSHEDGKVEGGSFAQYAHTKNLRHLPPGFRKRRALAIEVIKEYYTERPRDAESSDRAAPVKVPDMVIRGPTFTEEQLKAGLVARSENKTWKETAALMGVPDDDGRARRAVLKYSESLSNPGSGSVNEDDDANPEAGGVDTDPATLPQMSDQELAKFTPASEARPPRRGAPRP